MAFLGFALGLTAICSLAWGNLVAFDWNDLPVGREFDCKFLKKVKSPPYALPPSPPATDRCIIPAEACRLQDDVIVLFLASSTTPRRRNLLVALAQYTVTHFWSSSWFLSSLIPALSVDCKRSFNGKVESHTKPTPTLLFFYRTTPYLLKQRKTMAKNTLVRAKILKVNTRFHAGIDVQPVTPCNFSPKIIYVSKRSYWAFPSVSN